MQHRKPVIASLVSLSISFAAVLAGCGTSGRSDIPQNANIEVLQTEKLVLRGTAESLPGAASCQGTAPKNPKHLLELKEETHGSLRLRPAMGEAAPAVAMLHVTHLDSNRTWCATASGDKAAMIPGQFPSGVYAITVAEPTSAPSRYEVVIEKL